MILGHTSRLKHIRSLIWVNDKDSSQEYFSLYSTNNGYMFMGTVIMLGSAPTVIEYTVTCDEHWKTKQVEVRQEHEGKINLLTLAVGKNQKWHTNQAELPFATGLLDVDLAFSPATNTLHIQRLNLKIDETKEVEAVWVLSEELKLEKIWQTYTRIDERHYDYEHPASHLRALLEVDEFGLIVRYGDLWRRL